MEHTSFRDRVANYLKDRPGEWVDGPTLAELGGWYAWRSRVSNCRTQLGMTIENRQRRVYIGGGEPDEFYIVSEYRYCPASLLEIAS